MPIIVPDPPVPLTTFGVGSGAIIEKLLLQYGSDATIHRDDSLMPCPCRTPEGSRDPRWHLANLLATVCNENGFLPAANEILTKAFIQPVASTRGVRMSEERGVFPVGEIDTDDHVGIFPTKWNSQVIDFRNWGPANEDYIAYNGRKYTLVNVNLMPDALTGNPNGHWELALRLIS